MKTRIVAPLIPEEDAPKPAARLNPIFEIQDRRFVMVTQFLSAVPVRDLERHVCSLLPEQDRISIASDMLLVGF
jgi:toxin CcdB